MSKWIRIRYQHAILIVIGSLLLTACASTPKLLKISSEIDALATSDAQQKHHFVILSRDKGVREQDLEFIEFKAYVEKALISRGFVKAQTLQEGDLVLFLSYGVSAPQTYQYTYDVPAWYGAWGWGTYPYFMRSWYYPMSPYYIQRFQSLLIYRRYLSLEAYDMAAYLQKKTPIQLWKINVQSQGVSNDLRLVFPYMVAAMQPYLGFNTGHMVTVDIDESNPLLQDILRSNPNRVLPVVSEQKKTLPKP